MIQSIKYRELTPEEVERLKIKVWGLKEYLRRSAIVHGDVGQHWVEQASATAELHGFRLFQNTPDYAEDGFMQIRAYHMKDFHKRDASQYIARLQLNLQEAFNLMYPTKSFSRAYPGLVGVKRPSQNQQA